MCCNRNTELQNILVPDGNIGSLLKYTQEYSSKNKVTEFYKL